MDPDRKDSGICTGHRFGSEYDTPVFDGLLRRVIWQTGGGEMPMMKLDRDGRLLCEFSWTSNDADSFLENCLHHG